jgi:hypothetical protein
MKNGLKIQATNNPPPIGDGRFEKLPKVRAEPKSACGN